MSEYTPARWVVLEVNNGKETVNKVFAGWYGGYGGSDSWKLNSGNFKEEEFDDRWEFTGYSGSVYICRKSAYGMSVYMGQVYQTWLDGLKEYPDKGSMKIIDSYEPSTRD